MDGELSFVIARIRRVEGPLSFVEEVTTATSSSGAVQTDRNLIIAETSPESGLVVRNDQLAADDRDTAEMHFDARAQELSALDSLVNTASWFSNRAHTWARAAAWDRAGSVFAEDVVVGVADGTVLLSGRQALADAGAAAGVGFGVAERRVLAVRGEQLALMAWRDDDRDDHDRDDDDGEPFRRFAVLELNARAEFTRITLFDWAVDALASAADLIDDRWIELGGVEASHASSPSYKIGQAYRSLDADRLSELMSDEIVIWDRKQLAWPKMGKDEWLRAASAIADLSGVGIVGSFLSIGDRATAVQLSLWGVSEGGDLIEMLPGVYLTIDDGRQITRVENFPPGEGDAALARLAELTTATADAAEHEPWNDADRRMRHALCAFEHDPAAWRDVLAPDVEYRDVRPLVADAYHGRDEVEAAFPPGFMTQIEVETLASRGDRFVLCRSLMATNDEGHTIEMEFLIVQRWTDGGHLALTELFDPDDLESAVDELDRLYLDSDPGAVEYATIRTMREWAATYTNGRTDDHAARLHDEFESVDRRQFGWPTLDRSTAGQRSQSMRDVGNAVAYLARIHPTPGSPLMLELGARIEAQNGSQVQHAARVITLQEPDSGLQLRDELFAIDDLSAAQQRWEEIRAEYVEPARTTNLASKLTNRAHSLMRRGRWDLAAPMLAEGLNVETGQGHPLMRSAEVSDAESARGAGFGVDERRVIAVRGDRLALMSWGDDDLDGEQYRRFALVELNRRAEIERVTLFDWDVDSLIAAADLLEERWLELEPQTDLGRLALAYEQSFRHRDVERLSTFLHDDFTAVDERPLGWGSFDKTAWLEVFEADMPSPIATVVGQVLAETDAGIAGRMSQWTLVDGGLVEALPITAIALIRDGSIFHVEAHDPDDPEAAIERLHELTAESRSSDDSEPWNAADELPHLFVARLAARDVDRYVEDLAQDVILDDRREVIQSIHRGRDEVVAFLAPGIYPLDQELVANVETVASRGDGCALHQCTIREVDVRDGPTMAWLSVTEWEADQLTRAVLFDPDDFLGAVAELDRLFLEHCDDDALRLLIAELGASYRAISTRDLQRVMDLGHPEFTMADHRGIGWGKVDSGGFRERIRSIMDLDADLASFVVRVHRSEQHVAFLAEGCHRVTLPSGAVQVERHLLVSALDAETGMAKRMDFFGVEQFDEAAALHDRLTDGVETERRRDNITVVVANRANFLARLERWELFLEALSPELAVEDSSGTRLVADTGAPAGPIAAKRLGFGLESRRVLAVRGERLALVELRDPDVDGEPFHRFVVEETNREHSIVRVALYEPHELAEAADDFDRRWLALDDSGHDEMLALIARNTNAFRHLDADTAADTIAPDYTFADHRAMGYPELDRDAYLAVFETVGDAHGVVVTTEGGHPRASSGLVAPMINFSVSDGGELVENQVAVVMVHVRDGLIANLEMFPEGEFDAAIARLDELSAR
ncbi:MAG: hypothetical protein QNM02_14680 [Acidimicrobiia bacterium]|nr:hypothetical protein [Acidimicrobiia bacterium]